MAVPLHGRARLRRAYERLPLPVLRRLAHGPREAAMTLDDGRRRVYTMGNGMRPANTTGNGNRHFVLCL